VALGIDQLREGTTANCNEAGADHFKDASFVGAAKVWHDAKLLAEGGFTDSQEQAPEQRHERTEAELFAPIEGMGRELENRVTGDDSKRLKDQGEKAETISEADYGSADDYRAFAASLAGTASEERVESRLASARSEGIHVRTALAPSKTPATACAALEAQKSKNSPSR
jgi:hypothetical protein